MAISVKTRLNACTTGSLWTAMCTDEGYGLEHFHPSRQSDAYMCQWISFIASNIACRLFVEKPLSTLMLAYLSLHHWKHSSANCMMTSSNRTIFRVTGPLCREFAGHRWIPITNASDAKLWFLLLSAPEKNGWVNNRDAGDLRRHRAHYEITNRIKVEQFSAITWNGYGCLHHGDHFVSVSGVKGW